MTRGRPIDPLPRTVWSSEHLEADRRQAIAVFQRERLEEPLEEYLERFDRVQAVVEEVIERTVDLSQIHDHALDILTDPDQLEVFRYLAGPPISLDDLKTVVDARSLAASVLKRDPALVQQCVDTIRTGLDRRRFPWVTENREPSEPEREAAVTATAALIAVQRLQTSRRTMGKRQQEGRVRDALRSVGFSLVSVPGKSIRSLVDPPSDGQFTDEVTLGTRKADLVVRLWDGRFMPIECKVSNSSTNSVKRLNNDAAVKAEIWMKDFGVRQIVSAAVLSGVYKLHNLEEAQRRGLVIYWAHRLSDLTDWIEQTKTV